MIVCPSCKTPIDLNKLSEEKYKLELEAEFEKERAEMRKKAQDFAEEKMKQQADKDALEMKDLKAQLEESGKRQAEFEKNELEMRKKTRELEQKEKNMELEMDKKMESERKKIELQMAESQEIAIKKQVEEQKKIDEDIVKRVQEDHRKKELEMQKQQEQMKKTIDDLKRKAEQGSQQIQWDIQEDDLKHSLQMNFPIDRIEDVPTGIKWADIIQWVRDSLGQEAGTIIWESKNTKAWQDGWISKLKDDKIAAKANIAIIITTVLPKDMNNFGMIDDIIVTLPEYALQVVWILRDKLLSISKVEKSLEWKDMKMEMLYKYLTSEEFGSKVGWIIDAFENLKSDIDTERRAMERIWKKREKQLERVIMSTSMMQGDFEWIIGQGLPGWERLMLDDWSDEI